MSIKELAESIKTIEKKRREILKALTADSEVIVGSITQTKGRCGKPNCACFDKPSHEITLLLTVENGKNKSQLIRKGDVKKMVALWQKYKTLKEMIKRLQECNQEEIEMLYKLIRCRNKSYKPL